MNVEWLAEKKQDPSFKSEKVANNPNNTPKNIDDTLFVCSLLIQ